MDLPDTAYSRDILSRQQLRWRVETEDGPSGIEPHLLLNTVYSYDVLPKLTKLPRYHSGSEDVPSGIVSIRNTDDFQNRRLTNVNVNDYSPKDDHNLQRWAMNDKTWIVWNLPVGRVVTIREDETIPDSKEYLTSSSGLGKTFDLIGTGKTETADLLQHKMWDLGFDFCWRDVDLRYGAVQLFQNPGLTGICKTVFLSEWTPDMMCVLPDAYVGVKSIRWISVSNDYNMTFYKRDSNGRTFTETLERVNDRDKMIWDASQIAAFKWNPSIPVKEIIKPIRLDFSTGKQLDKQSYENKFDVAQEHICRYSGRESKTLTISTPQTFVAGIKMKVSSIEFKMPGPMSGQGFCNLELEYEYTTNPNNMISTTEIVDKTSESKITVAPLQTATTTMWLQVGDVRQRDYEPNVTRWYKEQVTGSVRDDSNQGWFKREEHTSVTVAGKLACTYDFQTEFEAYSTPASRTVAWLKTAEGKPVRSLDETWYFILDQKLRRTDRSVSMSLYGDMRYREQYHWEVINAMPKGADITANPPLITPPGGGKIYLVDDGKKRWIQGPKIFDYYGFAWKNVATVDVEAYPDGPDITALGKNFL